MILTEPISITLLLLLAIDAGLLYLIFWFIRKVIYPLIKIRRIQRLTEKWLFRSQLIAWSAFAIFSVYRLLLDSPIITLILIIALLVLSWSFLKDFIPGILFQLENQITIRDIIRINGQESNVEAIGLRSLISSNAAGETIITPYHKLQNAVVVRARAEGKLIKHSFTLKFPEKEPAQAAEQIRQILLECPWSAPLQIPVVKRTGEREFQITAFAADKFAAERQKAYANWRVNNPV